MVTGAQKVKMEPISHLIVLFRSHLAAADADRSRVLQLEEIRIEAGDRRQADQLHLGGPPLGVGDRPADQAQRRVLEGQGDLPAVCFRPSRAEMVKPSAARLTPAKFWRPFRPSGWCSDGETNSSPN